MTRHALLFALTIGLTACGARHDQEAGAPPAPEGSASASPQVESPPAEAPAVAAATDSEAFDAVGTEPFWAVQVRADTLRLSRPDYAEVIVDAPHPRSAVNTLVWKAKGMTVSITPEACSDGMSDRRYAYVAEVRVGREILKGCAYRPGKPPSATPG
jgi:uncharacterized membrane protein